jgi:hypothetical protein
VVSELFVGELTGAMIVPCSFCGRRIASGISLSELGGDVRDTVTDARDCGVEERGTRLDDEALYCECRCEALRLQPALGVVGKDHLFRERAVSLADIDCRIPLVANDRSPGDVLAAEPLSRGDATDTSAESAKIFSSPSDHYELLLGYEPRRGKEDCFSSR